VGLNELYNKVQSPKKKSAQVVFTAGPGFVVGEVVETAFMVDL
jgi:hypothetical protein